jgi:ABC-type multidrug transport system ATPase subunit
VRQVAVDTLLQVVGLEERRWREVSAFSPGERRRLALASALVHEPDVLLLDDPLRGLDGLARLEQIEVLRELHRLGSTMLVAATRPEDLLEICESFAVMRDGAWYGAATPTRPPRWRDRSTRTPSGVRVELPKAWMQASRCWASGVTCELEVDEDGRNVWFLFSGDHEALANLLPQLIRAWLQRRPLRHRAPLASGCTCETFHAVAG